MTKKFLIALTFLFVFTIYPAFTQKVVKKISNETCNCLGKIDLNSDSLTLANETTNCMVNSIFYHSKELKEQMNIDITKKEEVGKVALEVFYSLFKKCDNLTKIVSKQNQLGTDKTSSPALENCKEVKFGKFIALSVNGDTSHYSCLIRDQNTVKEYDKEGRLLISSKIKWISDCEYTGVITDIYDDKIKNFLSKGEKLQVKIISIEGDIVTLESLMKGIYFTMKYKKVGE